jgi:hypothetical protein
MSAIDAVMAASILCGFDVNNIAVTFLTWDL